MVSLFSVATIFSVKDSETAIRALPRSSAKDAPAEMFVSCFYAGFTQAVLRFHYIPSCDNLCWGVLICQNWPRDPTKCRVLRTQWFSAQPYWGLWTGGASHQCIEMLQFRVQCLQFKGLHWRSEHLGNGAQTKRLVLVLSFCCLSNRLNLTTVL